MYANQRRKSNTIAEVSNAEGVQCSGPTKIGRAFLNNYQSLFSSSYPVGVDDCLQALEEKITPEMTAQLDMEFTSEEVHFAISQMSSYTSLGPNGFPPYFYHKYSPIIGKEICSAVLFCLNSAWSLESINDPNIVLIPKKKPATRVTDFWPISLCNVVYKIVSIGVWTQMDLACQKMYQFCFLLDPDQWSSLWSHPSYMRDQTRGTLCSLISLLCALKLSVAYFNRLNKQEWFRVFLLPEGGYD